MCFYCLSFVCNSFPSHDELLIMFTKHRLSQYENQNVSRPDHDFCHFVVDFGEFFVRLECLKYNVLVLLSITHVIPDGLNSNYLRRTVMADWLKHLAKEMGIPRSSLSSPPILNFPPLPAWMITFAWAFFLPATVKGFRTTE